MISKLQMLFKNNKFFISLVSVLMAIILIFVIALVAVTASLGGLKAQKDAAYKDYRTAFLKLQKENTTALENTVKASFTTPQVNRVVEKNSEYVLIINNQKADKETSIYYPNTAEVTVMLIENYTIKLQNLLPQNIINLGSMMKKSVIDKKVDISTNKAKYKATYKSSENSKMVIYKFSNIKPGEIITFEFDEKLATKLGIKDNVIEIIYNKAK